jgi:hypothetical protein
MTRVMPCPARADATAAAAEFTTRRGFTETVDERPFREEKRQMSVSAPSRSMMQACSRSAAGSFGLPFRAR